MLAAYEVLEPYEAPEPADPDVARLIVDFLKRTGYDANSSGRGWQIVVLMRLDRRQAVYVGPAGTDTEGRAILSLVSVCGAVSATAIAVACSSSMLVLSRGTSPSAFCAAKSISSSSRTCPSRY